MKLQEKLLSLREQLLQEFSPDDALPLGAPLFMETPYPCSPLAQKGCQSCDEVPFLRFSYRSEAALFSCILSLDGHFCTGHDSYIFGGWRQLVRRIQKSIGSEDVGVYE